MTCSYVFAASFDDLQDAINAGADKPEVSAPEGSHPTNEPAESTEGSGPDVETGSDGETGSDVVTGSDEETKQPTAEELNGTIVETGEDGTKYYGYGWSYDKETQTWTYGIKAWDVKANDDANDSTYDRHVQLKDDVSKDNGSSGSITIGKTPSGGSIYLDLGGFNITGGKDNHNQNNGATGSVVEVKGDGSLILDDTSTDKKGAITGGLTGVDISTGGSFTMNGGTISGNNGDGIGGGVVNRGDFIMNGGAISGNNVTGKGGGVYVTGTGDFEMNGGTISNNSATNYGGGVYVADKGSFTMNGGTISGNKTSLDKGSYDTTGDPVGQGGGVYVAEGGKFTMNATKDKDDNIIAIPVVEKNESGEGGGVFIAKGAVFTMNNGKVDNNIACIGEGGGIYIRGEGTIYAGSITNNKTYTVNDLGGGGIYIENSGKLQLYNTIITENTADGLGAGLAACVHGKTVIFVKDGAAIYNNTAEGKATSAGHDGNGNKIDGHDLWENDQAFKGGAQDIFTASDGSQEDWTTGEYGKPGIIIGSEMLGGGAAGWTGWKFAYKEDGTLEYDESGKPVFTPVTKDENGNLIYADRLLGVTSEPDEDTIRAAQAAAAAAGGGVFISGNYSATHGGGIANNGLLVIGKDVIKEEPPKELEGDKTLTKDPNAPDTTPDRPLQDKEFTFVLKDKDGNEVTTGTNDANGNISIKFPEGYFYQDLNEWGDGETSREYTFTVTERNTGDGNIIYDGTEYQIVVTITKQKVENLPDIENDNEMYNPDNVWEYVTEVTILKLGVDENGNPTSEPVDRMDFENRYTSTSTPEIPVRPGGGGDDDDDDDEEPYNPPTTPPEEPTVEVPEEEVPLANLPEDPEEEVEIPEEDVPLAVSPQTGDGSRTALWAALSGFSLLGMLGLMLGKKRDEL